MKKIYYNKDLFESGIIRYNNFPELLQYLSDITGINFSQRDNSYYKEYSKYFINPRECAGFLLYELKNLMESRYSMPEKPYDSLKKINNLIFSLVCETLKRKKVPQEEIEERIYSILSSVYGYTVYITPDKMSKLSANLSEEIAKILNDTLNYITEYVYNPKSSVITRDDKIFLITFGLNPKYTDSEPEGITLFSAIKEDHDKTPEKYKKLREYIYIREYSKIELNYPEQTIELLYPFITKNDYKNLLFHLLDKYGITKRLKNIYAKYIIKVASSGEPKGLLDLFYK